MFGSNVQPKRRLKPAREDWFCHKCNEDIRAYFNKCPGCGMRREH